MLDVPNDEIDPLVSIMSDPTCQDICEKIAVNDLFREKQGRILAARGFIAFGIFFHGLEARYRVNYGLNPSSSTKMAVRF